MAPDRLIDRPAAPRQLTTDQRQIATIDAAGLELGSQMLVALIVLGRHQHPRGVFIDPVDNPGTQLTTDSGQIVTMMQQGIDQCTGHMSGGGMYHHSGRFVNHDQVVIFVKDRQGNFFGNCFGLV